MFLGLLISLVLVAAFIASFAIACDAYGATRTRRWLLSIPRRLLRACFGFFKGFCGGLFSGAARDSIQNHPQTRVGTAASRTHTPRTVRSLDSPTRSSGSVSPFGVREGVQLLGLAYMVSRELGLVDAGDVDAEFDAEFEDSEPAAESELPPNPGDQYVQPYIRDGRVVDGHFRTNADATDLNNYSGPFGEHYRRLNRRN